MQIFSQRYWICRNNSIVTSLSVQILWPQPLGHVLLTLKVFVNLIKYGVEMGNVSQRQKCNQRVKKKCYHAYFNISPYYQNYTLYHVLKILFMYIAYIEDTL